MSRQQVDDDGICGFSAIKTVIRITISEQDNRVQLFFSNTNNQEYLSIYGTAEIIGWRKSRRDVVADC